MTESIPITYPYKATNEILKKKHKEKLLKDRPETLYSDLYKNGEVSNIIFYTEDPEAWHSAIRQHYPTVIRKGISNGWKLQVKEEDDSESDVMITANLYKNGTVMIQGNLKKFEKDFLQIKRKAQLNKTSPNTLKQPENTSISTHQATNEQSRDDSEDISLLHSIINDMKEKFREMELELVQLREEVHGAVQQTDPTEKEEDYRKEISMLKEEIQELKNQKEEYNKQLSIMREELRELREDRRKTSENGKQLPALKEQLTETIEELQSLEQTPPPTTTAINPSPPPDSYSQTQPQIVLLMDSNGKFVDEKKLFPRRNVTKIWCPNTQKALELLCEEQLGSPSHIIIHTGTNDLRAQQERVATALVNVAEKASSNFPNSRIILSTLLLRSDFHPDTIRHINARVSRDCALKPNVYLAQHPTLNLNSLYDHVHLHRRAVPIFAKTLKDIALSRSSSALQRPRGHPIEPLQRHPSNHRPLHRRNPTAGSMHHPGTHHISRPAAPSPHHSHEHQQEQHPGSQSYAEAASRSLINPSTSTVDSQPSPSQSRDLRNIQHMLTLLCSHLMG